MERGGEEKGGREEGEGIIDKREESERTGAKRREM